MFGARIKINFTVVLYLCYILSRRLDHSAAIQELFGFLGIGTKHNQPGVRHHLLSTLALGKKTISGLRPGPVQLFKSFCLLIWQSTETNVVRSESWTPKKSGIRIQPAVQ